MKRISIYIFIFFVSAATVFPVHAQLKNRIKNKYIEIQKQIEFARNVEALYSNETARRLISNAEKELFSARNAAGGRRIRRANDHLRSADFEINKALHLVLKQPVEERKEFLKQRILEAEELAAITYDSKVNLNIDACKKEMAKAENAWQLKDYKNILPHYRNASNYINNAINIARNRDKTIQQKASDEQTQLLLLLNRARSSVERTNDETAQKLFKKAESQIRESEDKYNNGNYVKAIEHYHQATRLLLRVIDISADKGDKKSANTLNEMITMDELIQNFQIQYKNNALAQDDKISLLMERILELQKSTHQAFDAGDYEKAEEYSRLARKSVERALQIAQSRIKEPHQQSRSSQVPDNIRTRISELRNRLKMNYSAEGDKLLNLADELYSQYVGFSSSRRKVLTYFTLQNITHITNVIDAFLNGTLKTADRDNIWYELTGIEEEIDSYRSRHGRMNIIQRNLLLRANDYHQRASDSFKQGYLVHAEECLKLSRAILNQLNKR